MNSNTPTTPILALDERDAAKALGVSPRTMWQLARDGHIPFVRIGARKLYRLSTLEAYLAEKEKGGDADE